MDTGWIGAGDGRIVVRDNFTVSNGTGQAANDFHAIVSVRDESVYIQAARATTTQGTVAGTLAPGPKPKDFKIDIDNIDVAAGGLLKFGWELDLNHFNQRWITWWWTKDGATIGDPRGGGGHNVGGPIAGGAGGGGPGQGGQGGGGGAGFFVHPFTIYNDERKEAVLSDFQLLATMTDYADLGSIPWSTADTIDLGPTGLRTIAANSTFTFDFETLGAYTGGHIYYRYTLADDFSSVVGDHPVEDPIGVPEPAATALCGAAALGALGAFRRRASRRGNQG